MKIEIRKEYDITGKIWYRIYINGVYETSFLKEDEARINVQLIKDNFKAGIKQTETILSEEI